jgi:D-alanyl-D-alanine carboxypeptidase
MNLEAGHSKTIFYILFFGSIFLLAYSIFLYTSYAFADEENTLSETNSNHQNLPQTTTTQQPIQETLIAKSYVIYDIESQKNIKSENSSTPLPLASLTKVITVATLLDMAKKSSTTLRDETKLIIKKALVSSSNEDADALGYIYSYSLGGLGI